MCAKYVMRMNNRTSIEKWQCVAQLCLHGYLHGQVPPAYSLAAFVKVNLQIILVFIKTRDSTEMPVYPFNTMLNLYDVVEFIRYI